MNQLHNETSPYLLQHQDNPVHWWPWGEEAFAEARARNVPVLLSIGYAACHWCHVMAEESFENEAIAAVMNRLFVCIKVDREERPDVDHAYQQALALMGQQGGWPLTMFLLPDKRPFWGGTYFPPQERHGLPAFVKVLESISTAYATESDKILFNAKILTDALKPHNGQNTIHGTGDILRYAQDVSSGLDPVHGGLAGAPKFPSLPVLSFLRDAACRTGDEKIAARVTEGLLRMCQGGLYDHIGGGFHRYCVDEEWLVPHFEKMLYDNALFIHILAETYRDRHHPVLAARCRETVAFLLRDMQEEGAFAASIDAGGKDTEGIFYVWHQDEIKNLLGEDADFFCSVYDVTAFGNWQGSNILNRLGKAEFMTQQEEDTLEKCREVLEHARLARTPPARDNKILCDINSDVIRSLVFAGFILDEKNWITCAERTFSFICTTMMDNAHRLCHVRTAGKNRPEVYLDDYAGMIAAALALYEATGKTDFLTLAKNWEKIIETDFFDSTNGGYFLQPASATDTWLRIKPAQDLPIPCGNSRMVENLTRLFLLTGDTGYQEKAEKTLRALLQEKLSIHHCTALQTDLFFQQPVLLKTTAAAAAQLRNLPLPLHCFLQEQSLNLVCIGTICLPPVTDDDFLRLVMQEIRKTAFTASNQA